MALSPSAMSPLAGTQRNPYGNRSPSPQQPLSKKDKKRNQYMAMSEDLRSSFSKERDAQYREQLIALQRDLNLITHADVNQPEPMDDDPEAIAQNAKNNPYQSELSTLAGRWYPAFVQEVNMTKEAKELNIIQINVLLPARTAFRMTDLK